MAGGPAVAMSGTRTGTRLAPLDGIRALAVLAVMLHHANVSWMPGGFLGVDTFFVLSGFLITTLLADERLRHGRIDAAAFWSRRARRLLPALLVMVGVVCAAFIGNDARAESLRIDAASAIGYVANWRFLASDADYFARTGDVSPLQHTWSLGIEEQFYLLVPLAALLVVALRWRRGHVLVAALVGAVASAAVMAIVFDPASPGRAYYATDTRLQGLLVGVALAMLLAGGRADRMASAAGGRRALHAVAMLGIAGTAFLWHEADGAEEWLYQGGFLVAGVATAAVIANVVLVPRGAIGRVLGLWPLRALGRISYGVYLWHWPIQLAITNRYTGWSGPGLIIGRMVLTVAVAAVSFFLIEEPIRRQTWRPQFTLTGFATAAVLTAAVAAAVLTPIDGPTTLVSAAEAPPASTAPRRTTTTTTTSLVPATSEVPAATTPVATGPVEIVPDTEPPPPAVGITASVLGDSVGQSLGRGLAGPGADYSVNVIDDGILGCGVTRSGEYTLNGTTSDLADECAVWDDIWADRLARDRPEVAVIQVGRHEVLDRVYEGQWTNLFDPAYADYVRSELVNAVAVAGSTGARVVLLTAPYYRRPEAPDGSQWPENDPARADIFNDLVYSVGSATGTPVVDLGGYTNPGGHYSSTVDGVRLRSDGVHYTGEGCAWFAPWLLPQWREIAGV